MLTVDDSAGVLKGTTLEIYRLMLKTNKPLGIREVQRALKLSSPSVAQYHITKLEQVGLVKKDAGNYVVNRVLLDSCIKISRFLVPRYLFYSVFSVVILILELTLLKPEVFSSYFFFYASATFVFCLIFCYETVRVWLKGNL
jgi:DNA-binding transcriptional ArsR family regulator